MFFPIKNGTKITVGEGFQCYIPPPPADKSQIINYDLPKEEQYWKREPIPKWYIERSLEEKYKQEQDLDQVLKGKKKSVFIDPMCERYRRREWHRRIFGVHIMINGELIYLTNHHYWYLQWCKYDHPENNGYPFYYRFSRDNFYIRQWSEENPKSLGYMFIGPRATGKCFGKGTKVMLYHGGFKRVEDVKVGDLLMGPNSKPRKVLKLSSGEDQLFEVVQNRGMNYVVNSNHVLSLKRNTGASFVGRVKKEVYKRNYPAFGNICNIPVLHFQNKSQSFKNTFSGYKVGVNYERKEVPINPYFLGLWLGDGNSQYPRVTNIDQEIIDWLGDFAKSENLNLVRVAESKQSPKVASYTLSSKGARTSKNPLLDTMRKYKLINNKHIPDCYLYNTREVRLKLLAGLIDTDGHFSKGRYELTQVRKILADQILILCNSLGFKASMQERVINGTVYYRVGFSGKINIPVLLDRKVNRGTPNKDNLVTRIDEINYLGRGEYFGFEVDGDHLFCLEDGTVTHNSNEEIAAITNRATYLHNHRAALQSKHYEDDAKGVLIQAKTVPLFNALPDFFKPEFAHSTNPQESLIFQRRSVKGKESEGMEFGPEHDLLSMIFAAMPGVKALDSDTLSDLFEDEIGKTSPNKVANIYDRHEVNIKCIFRNHRKIGLLRKTSTVEEMNEGGAECHNLWKESNPEILDGNGFTTSKIHRHLISALDTDTSLEDFIDQTGKNWGPACDPFGNVNRQIANIKIQADFDAVKHDLKKLSGRMRKNPRNETEAFIPDQSKSIFNVQLLTNRLNYLRNELPKPPYVRGNLYWLKDKFGPVGFQADEFAGRFNWAWFPDEYKNVNDPDKWKVLNNIGSEWGYDKQGKSRLLKFPKNDHLFRGATDPIKFTRTKDPRASKAASHGFRLFDMQVDYMVPQEKWQSHNFIYEYICRPDDPETYLEDMAMACIFLGMKMLPERNVPSVNEYFERNGLERFLAYPKDFIQGGAGINVQTQSDDAGYASTAEVIDYYTRRLITFINKHIDRFPFDNTIEDFLNFDSTNPTKSDPTVSAGFTLIHAEKISELEEKPESTLDEWFDIADNSGVIGRFKEEDEVENYDYN